MKRKSEVTDKEVLNLTGGLFPLKIVEPVKVGEGAGELKNGDKWVYAPIVQKNPSIGPIYHWVQSSEAKKLYHGEKFNLEPDILTFSREEFQQLSLPAVWPYQ